MTVRIAFGFLCILATLAVLLPHIGRLLERPNATRWTLFAFVLSRLGGWLACYVVSPDLVRSSDLVKYYYPEALLALGGQVPYLDFPSSYGPLFPYISGALLPLWNEHAAVALVMVICEIAAVCVMVVLAGRVRVERARWLYIYTMSPAALYWSGMLSYNSSTVLLCWAVAIAMLFVGRYGSSIVALGFSVLTGKVLGAMISVLWISDPRRRFTTLAFAVTGALAAFLITRHFGLDLLVPLLREGGRSTAGNLWFVASGVVPFAADSMIWNFGPVVLFALGVGALFAVLLKRWRNNPPSLAQFCAAVATIGWLFMIVSKKTYPHYTPMFLLFSVLALSAAHPRGLWIWVTVVVGAVGLVEPGLWNALRQPQLLSDVCRDGCDKSGVWMLVAADVVLIFGSAYLLALCMRAAIGQKALTSP